MTRDALAAMLETRERAWAARDAETLAATHAEDGVVVTPMFATVTGRAAILDSYRSLFHSFNDWTFKADTPIVEGDRVAQPFAVSATHTGQLMGLEPTGRRFDIDGVLLFTITPDGLIGRERRIYDFTGLLIQVGVLKSRPA